MFYYINLNLNLNLYNKIYIILKIMVKLINFKACVYIILQTFYDRKIICISKKIKDLTGWYFKYQYIKDVYNFFKIKYPTKNGRLDLYGTVGEYLRTMSPKDYFMIIEYENNINNFNFV